MPIMRGRADGYDAFGVLIAHAIEISPALSDVKLESWERAARFFLIGKLTGELDKQEPHYARIEIKVWLE